MKYLILNRDSLPHDGNVYEFEGTHYPDTELSFIWVDMPPGGYIRLHRHPYTEIFIIQEGIASFNVDGESLEAYAGQIILVPAGIPHKFRNACEKQLRQVDIHLSKEFVTLWLEDES